MSVSNEWAEWHLTPSGWIRGSFHLDCGDPVIASPPKDRVLTCVYKEFIPSKFSVAEESVVEEWSSGNKEEIQGLLKKFGKCPQRFFKG